MGWGERGRGGRGGPEMDVDTLPPLVRGGDLRDGAIDRSRLGALRLDGDDGAFRKGIRRIGPADLDVMGPAIDTIDDQVVAVVDLVREDRKSTRLNSRH